MLSHREMEEELWRLVSLPTAKLGMDKRLGLLDHIKEYGTHALVRGKGPRVPRKSGRSLTPGPMRQAEEEYLIAGLEWAVSHSKWPVFVSYDPTSRNAKRGLAMVTWYRELWTTVKRGLKGMTSATLPDTLFAWVAKGSLELLGDNLTLIHAWTNEPDPTTGAIYTLNNQGQAVPYNQPTTLPNVTGEYQHADSAGYQLPGVPTPLPYEPGNPPGTNPGQDTTNPPDLPIYHTIMGAEYISLPESYEALGRGLMAMYSDRLGKALKGTV